MRIKDRKIDPAAGAAEQIVTAPVAIAQSITGRAFSVVAPGHGFQVTRLDAHCIALTATLTFDAYLAGAEEVLSATAFSVNAGAAEKYDLTAFRARASGVVVEKAAVTGGTFTAAHVVTASKFGVILFQIDSAGTVSTKVPSATQAYDSAAEALAALPDADSGKVAIGSLAIANNAGDWTANTDDLTAASDLTTAVFTPTAATVTSVLTGVLTPVAGKVVAGTLSGTLANLKDRTGDKDILLTYTSGGSAAITNGTLRVGYRPFPMHGEFY